MRCSKLQYTNNTASIFFMRVFFLDLICVILSDVDRGNWQFRRFFSMKLIVMSLINVAAH